MSFYVALSIVDAAAATAAAFNPSRMTCRLNRADNNVSFGFETTSSSSQREHGDVLAAI